MEADAYDCGFSFIGIRLYIFIKERTNLQMNKENKSQDLRTRDEALNEIKLDAKLYHEYCQWQERFRDEFLEFMMGVRGVKMTYDPFFKHIFNPETHPERLSEFLSLIVGKPLKVKRELPKEHSRITEKGSLMIMDILVEFENGEMGNVEIQKIGYLFPGERATCYSSDMVMRQYERVKSERGKDFAYSDLKNVYTIIFMEESSKEFKNYPNEFIHRGEVTFDTGLGINMLQKYFYLPLDIFFSIMDNKDDKNALSELEAWLYFVGSDKPEDIEKIIRIYPKFTKMYEEIHRFRKNPKEAVGMFSDALRIMDENTVKLMIEQQKEELRAQAELIEKNKVEIAEKQAEIKDKEAEIKDKEAEIKDKEAEIVEKDLIIARQAEEIEKYRKMIGA